MYEYVGTCKQTFMKAGGKQISLTVAPGEIIDLSKYDASILEGLLTTNNFKKKAKKKEPIKAEVKENDGSQGL